MESGDDFGTSTALVDVDGDGMLDLIVGAWNDDDARSNSGAIYVLFLRASDCRTATPTVTPVPSVAAPTPQPSTGTPTGTAAPTMDGCVSDGTVASGQKISNHTAAYIT